MLCPTCGGDMHPCGSEAFRWKCDSCGHEYLVRLAKQGKALFDYTEIDIEQTDNVTTNSQGGEL